jgi:transcriptional regulator with XRE-family HTH domain
MTTLGNDLVREARKRAGLTQADLAARARMTPSAISRLESSGQDLSLDEVIRLVRHCGFDLETAIVAYDDSDMAQARRLSSLSGPQRMERHARLVRRLRSLRKARPHKVPGRIIPGE